jgi:SAM-dependent methyltransferase
MIQGVDKWDARYADTAETRPARVLLENMHLLPDHGAALDLACGLGANALLLASRGLEVCAWDSSSVAIDKLRALAQARGLTLQAEVRDVVQRPPEPGRFDVIVVSHFLDRDLTPHLIAALRADGLLFYQTFTRSRADERGPHNPDYLLADGELLTMFSPLHLMVYREEGLVGDIEQGFRGQVLLVASKVAISR